MKAKIFIILNVVIALTAFCRVSSAETIYFNDGRIIKAKIIEKGSYYVIIQEGNLPRKYFMGQIKRIEEDSLIDTVDTEGMDLEQYQQIGMPIDKAKLIVVLIDLSGVRENMEQNLQKVLESVPDENKGYYEQLFNVDEIIERLVPLYDKYYTEQELWDIVEFYDSPSGKKALEATPKIMKESIGVSLEYFKEKTGPNQPL